MTASIDLLLNPSLDRALPYGSHFTDIQNAAAALRALEAISRWSGYAPTPLISLPTIATKSGVANLYLKHEGHRFDLKSFKALGGAYAVESIAQLSGDATALTFTCATDGNHGRAVAWGAKRVGARAVIYVHETVSEGRARAIAELGAEVRREGKTYDAAVRAADAASRVNGWILVSDTAYEGYEDIPKLVMQGYSVLPIEIQSQIPQPPTHVFVPGGVGGLAASVLAYVWERHGVTRPKLIIVEPERAACLLASARAGHATTVGGDLETIMAGLSCGEPSSLAWRILQPGADAFAAIPDSSAIEAMRTLADLGYAVGESGVASLAGFLSIIEIPICRELLHLDTSSRVLVYGTEGATDPDLYRDLVGRHAGDVEPAA